jgi:hypothetical protein
MVRVRSTLLSVFLALLAFASHASALSGFDELEKSLRLNAVQKAQFDTAVAATQRALLSVGLAVLQVKGRLAEELAKPKPDLDALARAQEEAIEQTRPLFREARDEWARLYAMLDPDQVAATRAFVEEKLRRLERIGESLRGLLSENFRR